MNYELKLSTLTDNAIFLREYLESLSAPMDSYLEDNLDKAQIYAIFLDNSHAGFVGTLDKTLWFFYLAKPFLRQVQATFAYVVGTLDIVDVYFQTQDLLLVSLVMDWEFDKRKSAYFFEDGLKVAKPPLSYADVSVTQATLIDYPYIQQETNNFFDESDLSKGTIFMLRAGEDLLGCGIAVPGRYFPGYASIGMVTCSRFRRQGVGTYILWWLKEWCYAQGLKPLAGCWYYNTLSRKSLQAAGFVSRARGMRAVLRGKEDIPERTGNYPGEPVL